MKNLLRATIVTIVLSLAASVVTLAKDNPLAGTWKFNPDKSDFSGEQLTIKQVGPDEMEISAYGRSYRFRLDGQQVPAFFGYEAAWTRTGENMWQSVVTLKGKQIGTDIYRLSPDGKTLTVTASGTNAQGTPFEETMVYRRSESADVPTGTAGGTEAGLAGNWKGEDFTSKAPGMIEIQPDGDEGITIRMPAWGTQASVKFDGKDYPMTGEMMPPGLTLSLTRTGPSNFDATYKQDGKVVWTAKWTVSEDGETLTVVERVPGAEGENKAVFERQ